MRTGVTPCDHAVLFYSGNEELVTAVGSYLADGLRAGEVAIVIATETHRNAIEDGLAKQGVDVETARRDGFLVTRDAAETLATLMRSNGPDPGRFGTVVGGLIREGRATGRAVRAYGEMVALLWDGGDVASAMDLEVLWNELQTQETFALFCAYPSASVYDEGLTQAREEVCRLHSEVIGDIPPWQTHRFPCAPEAPRDARRFVCDVLSQWHLGDLAEEASVVVTEFVTNAVQHAQSGGTVTVRRVDGSARITVSDGSASPPKVRSASGSDTTGRGLVLVSALARAWGYERVEGGKSVWAEIGPSPTDGDARTGPGR